MTHKSVACFDGLEDSIVPEVFCTNRTGEESGNRHALPIPVSSLVSHPPAASSHYSICMFYKKKPWTGENQGCRESSMAMLERERLGNLDNRGKLHTNIDSIKQMRQDSSKKLRTTSPTGSFSFRDYRSQIPHAVPWEYGKVANPSQILRCLLRRRHLQTRVWLVACG